MLPISQTVLPNDVRVQRSLWARTIHSYTTTNLFNQLYFNKSIGLKLHLNEYRVKINSNVAFAIACYAEISVLQLLGFWSQSTQLKIQGKRSVKFMIISQYRTIKADLPPSLEQIINIYVYSDIVELFRVNNSQVHIMGLFPIKSQFQNTGNWVFNPPINVRIREKNINNIIIKISTETGDEFPIQYGLVTCRLRFRRRPLLT